MTSVVIDERCRFGTASFVKQRCDSLATWTCPEKDEPMWCSRHRHADDLEYVPVELRK